VYTIEGAQDMTLMEDLFAEGPTPENLALADVKRWVTGAFPETFLFTCTGDFLQEQADAMQVALRKAQVPHVLRFYGDAAHALGHDFQCDMRSEAARRCNDEQCAFFRRMLRDHE
jgi:acetyl esterase/lipase